MILSSSSNPNTNPNTSPDTSPNTSPDTSPKRKMNSFHLFKITKGLQKANAAHKLYRVAGSPSLSGLGGRDNPGSPDNPDAPDAPGDGKKEGGFVDGVVSGAKQALGTFIGSFASAAGAEMARQVAGAIFRQSDGNENSGSEDQESEPQEGEQDSELEEGSEETKGADRGASEDAEEGGA